MLAGKKVVGCYWTSAAKNVTTTTTSISLPFSALLSAIFGYITLTSDAEEKEKNKHPKNYFEQCACKICNKKLHFYWQIGLALSKGQYFKFFLFKTDLLVFWSIVDKFNCEPVVGSHWASSTLLLAFGCIEAVQQQTNWKETEKEHRCISLWRCNASSQPVVTNWQIGKCQW